MATENLKDLRPTVGSSYSYGWNLMFKYFLYALLLTFVSMFIGTPASWVVKFSDVHFIPALAFLNIFSLAYFLFLVGPISYGIQKVFMKMARNEKFKLEEMFDGFNDYLNVVLANLLVSAVIGLGMLFLIIPGIIFACRLAFVPYLVMEYKMDAVQAFEKSWRMTKGHGWTIFGMGLLAIPIAILGLLLLGVGIIFSAMWISLAFAAIYVAVVPKPNGGPEDKMVEEPKPEENKESQENKDKE